MPTPSEPSAVPTVPSDLKPDVPSDVPSDVQSAPVAQDPAPGGARGRRTLLTAGATAVLGALGIAAARPAAAAAGAAALLGRANTSGTATTALASTSTASTLWTQASAGHSVLADTASSARFGVFARNVATAAGAGGAVRAEGRAATGVLADTTAASRWAVVARNTAVPTGAAGALRAEGGRNTGVYAVSGSNLAWAARVVNTGAASATAPGGALRVEGRLTTGLFADTDPGVADVPAVLAIGGDGQFNGTAVLASGTSYLDGQALALRGYVGVLSTDPGTGTTFLTYAPVTSGEEDYHTVSDAVTLDGSGNATVDLATDFAARYKDFPVAVDMTTLRIGLTAVGQAMPSLHAVWTPSTAHVTTFGIGGGEPGGTVHFTITAQRVQVSLADVATPSAAAAAPSSSLAASRTPRAHAAPARVVRGIAPRIR